MKSYLSTSPVYFKPTDRIRAFDDKSIVIVQGEHRTPAHLRVSDADPDSSDSGLCSVVAWQASLEDADVQWADAGSPIPTSQSHHWQRYLTEDALSKIRSNDGDDSMYGDLLLEVPDDTKA